MTNYSLQEHISKRIRFLRRQRQWSQEELSEKADLGINYIHTIENKQSNIKIETLDKIMLALKVTPEEFFNFQAINTSNEARQLFEHVSQLPKPKQRQILKAFQMLLDSLD